MSIAGRDQEPSFAQLARRVFAFLTHLNFTVVNQDVEAVRYESEAVFVNIYRGHFSHQLGLEIGRIDRKELYSLHEVLTVFAPNDAEKARYQTKDDALLEAYLVKIASVVKRCCSSLLRGDESAFDALRSQIAHLRREATTQAQFGAIMDKGDIAWERKDYKQAAECYAAAERGLDATRKRRLNYLRGTQTDI